MKLKTRLLVLALGLLLLPGCLSRVAIDADAEREIETLTRQLVRVLMQKEPQGLAAVVSLPFWEGAWTSTLRDFRAEQFDGPAPVPVRPDEVDVRLRLYPLADLAALRPEVWQDLKASSPEQLQGLYLAVAGLTFKDNGRTDALILLLRHVDGHWRVAGLFEAR